MSHAFEQIESYDKSHTPDRAPGEGDASLQQESARLNGDVQTLLGEDLQDVGSFDDAKQALTNPVQRVADGGAEAQSSEKVRTTFPPIVATLLQDIENHARDLADKNTEHRVEDFRDWIPVWQNMRSHGLATKEGEIIDALKTDVSMLEGIVKDGNLPLDLKALVQLSQQWKKPEGIMKIMASIVPGVRTLHRNMTAPRAENLKTAATQLRRQVQEVQRKETNALAA